MANLRRVCLFALVAACGCGPVGNGAAPSVVAPGPAGGAKSPSGIAQVGPKSAAVTSIVVAPLVAGNLRVVAATADDWAIYQDLAAGTLDAVPLAGGAPVEISEQLDRGLIVPGRHVVFAWESVDPASQAGALRIWSPSGGVRQAATAAALPMVGESADGNHLVFTDRVAPDGTHGDVILASADLATRITLSSDVALGDESTCTAQLGIAGDHVFLGACSEGSESATVTAFDFTGVARAISSDSNGPFSVDDAGSQVLILDGSGALSLIPMAGGESRLLDDNVAAAALFGDGSAVVYQTSDGVLRRRDASGSVPAITLASGVESFDQLSPDGRQVMFETVTGDDGYTDLQSVATDGSQSPLMLDPSADGCVFGDAFTTDSLRALYVSGIETQNYTGTLAIRPVDGGAATVLGTGSRIALAAQLGQVVYDDGFAFPAVSEIHARADLHVVDPALGAPARLLASQADPDIALDAARARVIFTSSVAIAGPGLYVLPL
jgi:hypothetical protein